jgi:hypothetical protein
MYGVYVPASCFDLFDRHPKDTSSEAAAMLSPFAFATEDYPPSTWRDVVAPVAKEDKKICVELPQTMGAEGRSGFYLDGPPRFRVALNLIQDPLS